MIHEQKAKPSNSSKWVLVESLEPDRCEGDNFITARLCKAQLLADKIVKMYYLTFQNHAFQSKSAHSGNFGFVTRVSYWLSRQTNNLN